jgi:hypothetical protein
LEFGASESRVLRETEKNSARYRTACYYKWLPFNHEKDNRMTFLEFSSQFFTVINAVQDSLENFPLRLQTGISTNWVHSQAALQIVAGDLIGCVDVKQAVKRLRSEKSIMILVLALTIELKESAFISIMERAYEFTITPRSELPGQALAAFLLELSKLPKLPMVLSR